MTSSAASGSAHLDPELEALPEPRRPWRRTTLVVMALTGIASSALALSLMSRAAYALRSGAPLSLGDLTSVQLTRDKANQWVQGTGELAETVVQYRRPLDGDTFRLSPAESHPRLWIEVRVPSDLDASRFVPPTSFVGRLVPLDEAGLSHSSIRASVEATRSAPMPEDAWLLVDGEAPATSRWILGVVALLVAFTAFSIGGIVHLLRPVR